MKTAQESTPYQFVPKSFDYRYVEYNFFILVVYITTDT